jgi:hypothetical protein
LSDGLVDVEGAAVDLLDAEQLREGLEDLAADHGGSWWAP